MTYLLSVAFTKVVDVILAALKEMVKKASSVTLNNKLAHLLT
jgi:hypothetical protein